MRLLPMARRRGVARRCRPFAAMVIAGRCSFLLLFVLFHAVNAWQPSTCSRRHSQTFTVVQRPQGLLQSLLLQQQQHHLQQSSKRRLVVAAAAASTASNNENASGVEAPAMTKMSRQEPDMQAYALGYTTVFDEVSYRQCRPEVVSNGGDSDSQKTQEGTIPRDLLGASYFRAGPAMFSAGSIVPPRTSIVQPKQLPVKDGVDSKRMVRHPIEADGAVLGITFVQAGTGAGTSDDDDSDAVQDDESNNGDSAKNNISENDSIEAAVRFRMVRTAGFTKERKKGERLYTSLDSTRNMGGGPLSCANGLGNDVPLPLFRHYMQGGLNKLRKNTANTRAVYWGSRLLSLCEGSQPYKLDARAVSTEGRSRLGGAILRDADAFGSKLSYDAQRNHAVFYGVDLEEATASALSGRPQSRLTLYEFDANFTLVQSSSPSRGGGGSSSNTVKGASGRFTVDLPGVAILNDFCTTPNYAIFIQPNIEPKNPLQFLLNKEPGPTLQLDTTKPSLLHLIPRCVASPQCQQKSIPIPITPALDANVQFCNAFETDNGRTVIVDAILSDASSSANQKKATPLSWPWGRSLADYQQIATKKSLWRYTIDTQRDAVISKQQLLGDHVLFATINPRASSYQHRFIYVNIGALGAVVAPPQGIAKYDCQSGSVTQWLPERHEFCGEPMFAPKQKPSSEPSVDSTDEDEGYILSLLFDGQRKESELIVLNAQNIAAGPICRIPLGFAVPHGLYGCLTYDETVIGTADEIERRAKLADKIESRGNRWNEVKSDFSGLGLRLDDMEEYFGDWNPFA